jgi:PAS domain S-box-containing protein
VVAVLLIASTLILSQWMTPHLGFPGTLFLCAVMLSAWFGGLGPGLLAATLSTLAFHYFFLHSPGPKPREIPRISMYFISNILFALLSAAQRSAKESLRHARDDLKGTVQYLQRTNEALHAESRERKQTEEALRRSEAYLAESQRLAHTGSWASKGGVITHWSEESFRIWGFDPHQGPPNPDIVVQRIHPEDRDRILECSRKGISERRDYVIEGRIVLPDGTVKHIHSSGHPVLSPSGELLEVVGTHVDITERKRAEEERQRLRQLEADLVHLNRVSSMGELTASLAHEVNQPIAAAVTDANTCLRWLARDQPDLDEARAAASRSVNDATRAAEIIKRVRLLFRKDTLQLEPVDLNEVIQDMMLLLRSEATQFAVLVRTELAPDLPQVTGDRVQLQQVLMNLMMNSIDAMKDVDASRELTIQSQRSENAEVLISVSDTGMGLPPQHADRIFDAFFTTKTNGTGMGLQISRSIVESHGGRLWAVDNPPRGARFCFTLPVSGETRDSVVSEGRTELADGLGLESYDRRSQ